jgi:hypothetical protein
MIYKALIEDIKTLFESQQQLAKQALEVYTPMVEDIITNEVRDENRIGHTLDRILDFCFDGNMLLLYKKLCRYYWEINPHATANYINYYREMWDSESEENPQS